MAKSNFNGRVPIESRGGLQCFVGGVAVELQTEMHQLKGSLKKSKQKTKKRTKAAFRKQAAEARKKSREIHNFSS